MEPEAAGLGMRREKQPHLNAAGITKMIERTM